MQRDKKYVLDKMNEVMFKIFELIVQEVNLKGMNSIYTLINKYARTMS